MSWSVNSDSFLTQLSEIFRIKKAYINRIKDNWPFFNAFKGKAITFSSKLWIIHHDIVKNNVSLQHVNQIKDLIIIFD